MIKKLGYVVLGASDVDAMIDHYTGSLALEVTEQGGALTWLSTGGGAPCLGLETAAPGLRRTGLELAIGLDEAEAELRAKGIAVTRCNNPAPGVSAALEVTGPDGVPLQLHAPSDQAEPKPADGESPRKLGHVATFVNDLEAAESFFRDCLGLRWSDSVALGDTRFFTFMRCGPDHHTMNFMENTQEQGLHHLAFEARDIEHLKDVCDRFARSGVALDWGIGRHGPGHNLFTYHRDPEGNLVEVFTELDLMLDETAGAYDPRPWHEDTPQVPKVWQFSPPVANTWGPGPSDPEFLKTPAWIAEAIAAAHA